MKRGLLLVSTILILLGVLGVLLVFDIGRTPPEVAIVDFEECARAGYPIMESYPRQCATPDGKQFTEVIATTTPSTSGTAPSSPAATSTATTTPKTDPATLIKITSVKSGDKITSPFKVTGEAKGPWYFEATFPIQLVDAHGKLIVETYAEAQGEWMTEKFVPFTANIIFENPDTPTGSLIFMNANPSGDEERSLHITIPITFK
jgi:hypothetical protein